MKLNKIAMLVLASSLCLAGSVYAATKGAYVGGGLGYSSLDNFSDASKTNNGGLGGLLFAGYNFNQYVGLEASYRIYDETNYEVDDFNFLNFDYNLKAVALVAKGYVPITDDGKFDFFGSLGFAMVYGKGKVMLDNYKLGSSSNDAIVAAASIGASYAITPKTVVSLESSFMGGKDGDDNDIGIPQSTLTTLNISYHFA